MSGSEVGETEAAAGALPAAVAAVTAVAAVAAVAAEGVVTGAAAAALKPFEFRSRPELIQVFLDPRSLCDIPQESAYLKLA